MRRGLAGLVLGLSLIVASVAWAGFTMSRTILDPGRSERLAEQLFENEQLRSALVGRVAAGLGAALPEGAPPVPDQLLESAADRALDDENVQALVRDGIVRTHRNALEGNVEPVTIDAAALGTAARAALVETRPELAAVLPEVPEVAVTLPTSGLSRLGAVKDFVDRFTLLAALAALAGALTSLLVTSDRPAVLRRVAGWAFGAAGFWLVIGFAIPWLANRVAPTSAAIVAAIIDVFFGAMIPPAIAMGVVGLALYGASILWGSMSARAGAVATQGRRDGGGRASTSAAPVREQPRPTMGAVSNVRQATSPPAQRPRPSATADPTLAQPMPTGQTPAAHSPNASTPGGRPDGYVPVNPTTAGQPRSNQAQSGQAHAGQAQAGQPHARSQAPASDTTDVWALTQPQPQAQPRPAKVWIEGVGYVEHDDPRAGGGQPPA